MNQQFSQIPELAFATKLLEIQPIPVQQKHLSKEDPIDFSIQPPDAHFFIQQNNQPSAINELQFNARIVKWQKQENIKERALKQSKSLKSKLRKGVPPSMRQIIWPQLISTSVTATQFESCKKMTVSLSHQFAPISADANRTFQNNFLFQQDQILHKHLIEVLVYIADYRPEISYRSGFNFLVGAVLLTLNQQETFRVSIDILEQREMFLISHIRQKCYFQALDYFIDKYFHKIALLFMSLHLESMQFAFEWVITLFSSSLEYNRWVRFMDVFLIDREKMVFRMALFIIQTKEKELIKKNSMEEVYSCLKDLSDVNNLPEDEIIQKAIKSFPFSTKEMNDTISRFGSSQ